MVRQSGMRKGNHVQCEDNSFGTSTIFMHNEITNQASGVEYLEIEDFAWTKVIIHKFSTLLVLLVFRWDQKPSNAKCSMSSKTNSLTIQ